MDRPVRKDIRLDNYDYSRNGAYFITICTKNKMCIFWDNNDKYKPIADNQPPIVGAASRRPQNNDKKIHLSEYGKIVKSEVDSFIKRQNYYIALLRAVERRTSLQKTRT